MKKKILLIIMSVLCIVLAGCGGSSESGKEAGKPKEAAYKVEARDFDKNYRQEGLLKIKEEMSKAWDPIIEKYGDTPKAYDEIEKLNDVDKYKAFREKLVSVKIENAEVRPLKDLLLKETDALITGLRTAIVERDYWDSKGTAVKYFQATFAYRNNFSLIVEGKPLPVINSSYGQLYAHEASNVLFGIANVKEKKELGNAYVSEKAKGKFIIVTVAIFNNQKDAITIDASRFKLIDKEGREYVSSSKGLVGLSLENKNANSFLEQLNPNMSMESIIVFDMPPNVRAKEYDLVTSGGFTGEELKLPLVNDRNGY